MSNPGPPDLSPEQQRPDYAPSSSSEEGDSDRDNDEYENIPAFKNLPVVPDADKLEADPATWQEKKDRKYYHVIPGWVMPDEEDAKLRRPALLPADINPSTYAQRFGIDPEAPETNRGRSMLTPIQDVYGDASQVPDWVEEFQTFMFRGYTADDLKAQGAFDPNMDFPDLSLDGLQGNIHPLLRRENWQQPEIEGNDEGVPFLWYQIPDKSSGTIKSGRYDISKKGNGDLWTAMQPALRLASKVLYSNPPFWTALFELYNRRPIDHRLAPTTLEDGTSLTSFWLGEVDEDKMYPEAKELRRLGFNAAGITEYVLGKFLRLGFESLTDGKLGLTNIQRRSGRPKKKHIISVRIAVEIVWPLLVPGYSAAEKTAASMHIAATLLHELSHAVIAAQNIMMSYPGWNLDSELRGFTPNIDEPEAEEGYAFERSLWGGQVSYATTEYGMDKDDGFPATINVYLKRWPTAKGRPRPETVRGNGQPLDEEDKWPARLTEPPTWTVNCETALPVTMYGRLFHESFWGPGGPFAKYGQQALRMPTHEWEGRKLKTLFEPLYYDPKDVPRALGSKKAYQWMLLAEVYLTKRRQYAITEYMSILTGSLVEEGRLRKRLHYEKKTWPRGDADITRHVDEIRRLGQQLPGLLATCTQAQAGMANPGQEPVSLEDALASYIDNGRRMIVEATEVQRLLGFEIQHTQYLVLGILKQPDSARRDLERYMDIIRYRLRSLLGRRANEVIQMVSSVYDQYLNQIVPALPQQMDHDRYIDLRQLLNTFNTMSETIRATLPTIIDQLADLANTITMCLEEDDNGALARPPLNKFNYLLDASGIREMRTQRRDLRNLALRHMRLLPANSTELRIVNGWLGALRTHVALAGAATQAERAALQSAALPSLASLQM
ncbi:hypothetical protein VMCG_08868 [Cytospora schulzeri]|uniref:Uncharacterized protein n=1 Tax=Cytospora schulzeri TaxID=448051 RepID=A0A423VUZ4_9PEZI|nr:hypothetical protein VMCG_08868 [Valsa malicola]